MPRGILCEGWIVSRSKRKPTRPSCHALRCPGTEVPGVTAVEVLGGVKYSTWRLRGSQCGARSGRGTTRPARQVTGVPGASSTRACAAIGDTVRTRGPRQGASSSDRFQLVEALNGKHNAHGKVPCYTLAKAGGFREEESEERTHPADPRTWQVSANEIQNRAEPPYKSSFAREKYPLPGTSMHVVRFPGRLSASLAVCSRRWTVGGALETGNAPGPTHHRLS